MLPITRRAGVGWRLLRREVFVTSPAILVLPNVLRNAAAPNTLRGLTAAAAQASPARRQATLQLTRLALLAGIGGALVIAIVGLGRA